MTSPRRSTPTTLLVLLALATLPTASRADSCPPPESHVSPEGSTAEDPPEPLPVVGTQCPVTLYEAEDDPEGGLAADPAALEWRIDDQPIAFTARQAPDRVRDQPFGCWEYEAPTELGPDEVIERRWQVWILTPDEPLPEGLAELRGPDGPVTRFTVAADAEGCAESEPPRLSVCSPGVQACTEPWDEGAADPEAGLDADVLDDDPPGGDVGPPEADDRDDDGCSTFADDPPWWPAGIWLVVVALRRRPWRRLHRGEAA